MSIKGASKCMVKIHLHSFRGKSCGHLFSTTKDLKELLVAGEMLGIKSEWLQKKRIPAHFDIWSSKLTKAKTIFLIASREEFAAAMKDANSSPPSH